MPGAGDGDYVDCDTPPLYYEGARRYYVWQCRACGCGLRHVTETAPGEPGSEHFVCCDRPMVCDPNEVPRTSDIGDW